MKRMYVVMALFFIIGIVLLMIPHQRQEPVASVSSVTKAPTGFPVLSPSPTRVVVKKQFYQVLKVIDGDTIAISINGQKETIRLIGMDTPETVDPRKPVQCFGKEASAKAQELLSGQNVSLESDLTQGEWDKYHRLLRYVFLADGTFYNEFMIREGYAHEYTYQSNPYKYQRAFQQAQQQARSEKKGLWADNVCATAQSVPSSTTKNNSQQIADGNFSCEGKKTCTQMSSCAEAKFYLNTCGVTNIDSDKDGVPCESLCK